MAQVIKSNSKFISVPGVFTAEKLKPNPENVGAQTVKPLLRQGFVKQAAVLELEDFGGGPQEYAESIEEAVVEQSAEEKALALAAEECAIIKAEASERAAKIEEEARVEAERIIAEARQQADALLSDTAAECEKLKKEAADAGYAEGHGKGFAEGDAKGYEAGYDKGLLKCRDTLKELMKKLDETTHVKEQIYRQHEHELFDAIFTISNKVTSDSLKQKDKSVLRNMLKDASKRFRNSEFIKVTLSKLDVEEMGNVEVDALRSVFRENQHIEFEIIKDAPGGTLILDNGTEIADASIATQLKMIENLGMGNFRDKPEE